MEIAWIISFLSWVTTAERPWDPPLFDAGKTRAFKTASEVVSALCASSDGGSAINSSKVKDWLL
ncbi:Transcription initiation factor TFIID subunit taf73 [Bienertia sinuspersici]